MNQSSQGQWAFRQVELFLGLGVALLIVALDVRYLCHAGGLWRDEVSSVFFANMPSLIDVWKNNADSFPVLWLTLLHGWISWGPGSSDLALRFLGFLTSIAALAMYWWAARSAGVNVPWVLMVFLGLNPSIIIYGSEVRAYGLGIVTELAMLASLQLFASQPTFLRALGAATATLLCAQTLYANCFTVAAAGIGWGLVLLWQKQWKALGPLIGICGLAAISVLPYLHNYARQREWSDICQESNSLRYFWDNLIMTVSAGGIDMKYLGPGLLACVLIGCFWGIMRKRSDAASCGRGVPFWCLISMTVALASHFAYMRFLNKGASYWHNFPVLVLVLYCSELILDRIVASSPISQRLRLAGALVLATFFSFMDWHRVDGRMTSVDLMAARVARNANPADLVIVWPWYISCVFDRYYRGPARWIGLPDLEEKRWQDPDEFRKKMLQPDPIHKEIDLITQALKSGRRVWFVGGLKSLGTGVEPPKLPASPSGMDPLFWTHHHYSDNWSQHAAFLLLNHCPRVGYVAVAADGIGFQSIEAFPLLVAEGWQ